ncbi:MAG: hypothetical protein HC924_11405 [Synechococcaceae cyanobacterium SM2_3_2]|nr:hypothetical protein [Synechococcaceae cyanobacterium SM2_3_2]
MSILKVSLSKLSKMSDPNQEIKDLILALDKKLDGFDRKFETQIADLKSEVRLVKTELHAEIKLARAETQQAKTELQGEIALARAETQQAKTELQGEIALARAETQQAKTEVEGKIAEISGKIDGYGKRLDQQEFVSRGAVLALVVGVASGFIKYLFFTT